MTPQRILVTGADGFVGGHLLPALRTAYPGAELLTDFFEITEEAVVAREVERLRPDAVIHLAAIAAPNDARRDPALAWRVNLHGTLHLARAIMTHVPAAPLLFVGTADAYGASFRAGTALNERAPLAPQNTYGATKAAADLALGAMAAEGLRVVRLRPFNHTGPGQTDGFVVPAFAKQVARIERGLQEPVMAVGDLEPQRDFLDVRDVVAAYARCVGAELPPGTILNLASGQPRRVRDVLQALLDLAGVAAELRTDAARLRPTDIPMACGDSGQARALLGWEPAIAWEQTLRDVLDDWRGRL